MPVSGAEHSNVLQTGLESYAVNHVQDGNPLYVGKVRADGKWVIEKFDTTAGTMTYANWSNNPTAGAYGSAWINRLTLTFGGFDTITGII